MIAKSWGSRYLAGVGPLGYHVPAVNGAFHHGDSSTVEQQLLRLFVAGSIPAFRPTLLKTAPEIK
ncbi:MAG TPA: hypothetical protein VKZ53_27640 [Candidatus Angelobacter sp.]|nr:hypothetical protein [Candidatus Angelobacter sp.]